MKCLLRQIMLVFIALSLMLSLIWTALGEEADVVPLYGDALQEEADAQLREELGAFEITAHQRELARENEAG